MAKVLFIQDLAYEYFGTMHISSFLKREGHQCDILIGDLEKNIVKKVKQINPDLIAFSCLTPTMPWALIIAKSIKAQMDIPIIFGGSHVTLNPDDAFKNDEVDYVCVGEGEFPMKELCDAIDSNQSPLNIKNLWVKYDGKIKKNNLRPLICDLDSLPFPDREIYTKYSFFKGRVVKPMLLGRGCPYHCNYCHNHSKMKLYKGLGRYVRFRSIDHVVAEIDDIRSKYKLKRLHFIDDSFGMYKKWLREFLPHVKKRNITFIGAIRANCLDEELCQIYKENGLDFLSFAVETGDDDFRQGFLNKTVSDQDLRYASWLLRKYDIPFLTMNMVGLPHETLEQSFKTIELNIRLNPIYACCYVYQPYPNTEMFNYMLDHQMIDPSQLSEMGFLSYDKSILRQKDIDSQKNVQRFFALTVMFPQTFPIVKRIVRWRPNLIYDGIFYAFYTYFLLRFFRLTPTMVYHNAKYWLKYQFLNKKKVST